MIDLVKGKKYTCVFRINGGQVFTFYSAINDVVCEEDFVVVTTRFGLSLAKIINAKPDEKIDVTQCIVSIFDDSGLNEMRDSFFEDLDKKKELVKKLSSL